MADGVDFSNTAPTQMSNTVWRADDAAAMLFSRLSAVRTRAAQTPALPGVVTLVGGALVLLAVAQAVSAFRAGGSLPKPLIDFALIATPGAALVYTGFWMTDSAIEPQYYPRVIAWLLGGVVVIFGFIFLRDLHPGVTVE